jgi:lipopolysaccharide transport system ATP-binding protein
MTETAIKVENVSKLYKLGYVGSGTFRDDVKYYFDKLRGKRSEAELIAETNDRENKGNSEYVWALKDINFEVKRGEIWGVIGKNGAGKSTLLKILSKITSPTEGSVKYKGRIASLLEVGTGFHGELTGRENIYLNGAVLGMTKSEIKSKFDEIVDFAGVERYVDTPVKRYSSGMTVRLGFAVAAHLEPEILIVDEVLAVGDAEFQKKAIGKMQDISAGGGRTVLFVSHNMASVRKLCKKALLMRNGKIAMIDDVERVVDNYLSSEAKQIFKQEWELKDAPGNDFVRIKKVEVKAAENHILENFDVKTPLEISIEFYNNYAVSDKVYTSLHLCSQEGLCLFDVGSEIKAMKNGLIKNTLHIPANLLNDGSYFINFNILDASGPKLLFALNECLAFDIADARHDDLNYFAKWQGVIRPTFLSFTTEHVSGDAAN